MGEQGQKVRFTKREMETNQGNTTEKEPGMSDEVPKQPKCGKCRGFLNPDRDSSTGFKCLNCGCERPEKRGGDDMGETCKKPTCDAGKAGDSVYCEHHRDLKKITNEKQKKKRAGYVEKPSRRGRPPRTEPRQAPTPKKELSESGILIVQHIDEKIEELGAEIAVLKEARNVLKGKKG